MEEEEEVFEDPRDNEQVKYEFSDDEINLFVKRGFFPAEMGFIDDTFFKIRKEVKEKTHLEGDISVQKLVELSFEDKKQILFKKDSIMPQPIIFLELPKWNELFGSKELYYDVDPLKLEPYIAKYVRIINRCGMKTIFSCDGWHSAPHKSKEMTIIFRDRYSFLWHKMLFKTYINKDLFRWMDKESDRVVRYALPREDERKNRIYDKLDLAADIFVLNMDFLKQLKGKFVNEVNEKHIYMDSLTNSEIEEMMKEYLSKGLE